MSELPSPAQTTKKNTRPNSKKKKEHAHRPNSKKKARPPPKQQKKEHARRPNSKKKRNPPKQQKKNTPPRPNRKNKKHEHPPKQQKNEHARKVRGRVFFFFCCLGWVVFFFSLGGAHDPRPNRQKETRPRSNSKKQTPEKPKQQKTSDNKKNEHSYLILYEGGFLFPDCRGPPRWEPQLLLLLVGACYIQRPRVGIMEKKMETIIM